MTSPSVDFQPIHEELIASLRDAVGAVAEERRYLLAVSAFSMDETRDFVRMLLDGGGIQFVAVSDSRVVGWCDVVQNRFEGTRHGGTLGMGVVREFRQRRIGSELLRRTLDAAKLKGIERVELEVFSSNTRATALYEKFGFQREGIKRRARCVDGHWDDFIVMALLRDEA